MKSLLRFTALFLAFAFETAAADVVTYPAPPEFPASPDYTVSVDGQSVYAYQLPVASAAVFDFEGRAEVVIQTPRDVKWVDIRPRSLGIIPAFGGHEIRFALDRPCNLSIELNGEFSRNPLFLFAGGIPQNKPDRNDPHVRYFEGGRIHEAGIIDVTGGETVYIEGGAVVQGALRIENAEHVKILGRGILDGTRHRDWMQPGRRQRFVEILNSKDVALEGILLSNSQTWQVVPTNSDDVRISNIKIVSDNGGDDGIDVVSSRNVLIENSFIRTKDDNIAVKAFYKKNREDPGEPAVGVENVLARNCVFWNAAWGNALEIGFELRGPAVRSIAFLNSDIIHVEDGAALSIHNGDSAVVSDVVFDGIRIEDARQKLIDIGIFLTRYSVDAPKDEAELERRYMHGVWDNVMQVSDENRAFHAAHRGQVRNILFKNITVVDGLFPFSVLSGFDEEHAVDFVTFENFTVHGRKITNLKEGKFYTEHARNVSFR